MYDNLLALAGSSLPSINATFKAKTWADGRVLSPVPSCPRDLLRHSPRPYVQWLDDNLKICKFPNSGYQYKKSLLGKSGRYSTSSPSSSSESLARFSALSS